MKLWDKVGHPSYFPASLPDCLCHISLSRYSPLSLEIVEKPNYWPPIFLRTNDRPQLFYGTLLVGPTVHHLAKFGRVPFADLRLQSVAMKWNADCTEGG